MVGHWPVTLYRTGAPCCEPLIDRRRKIASIDGGCVLQADGQLNALVLPPSGEDFSWYSYDDCPVVRALDRQEAGPPPFTIRWTDHLVEVIEEGPEFSLCRHQTTGRALWVLTRYLCRQGDRTWCRATSSLWWRRPPEASWSKNRVSPAGTPDGRNDCKAFPKGYDRE